MAENLSWVLSMLALERRITLNLSWVLSMLALERRITLRRWFCGFIDGLLAIAVFLLPMAFQKAQDHQNRPKDTEVTTR